MKHFYTFIKFIGFFMFLLFAAEQINAQITINELICKDEIEPYFTDEEGGGTDWIELYNSGTEAVNIAGMFITDKPDDAPTEWQQIPDTDPTSTTIASGGFLVLICGAKDVAGNDIPTSIVDGVIFIDVGIKASNDDNITLYDVNQNMLDQSGDIPNELEDESSYGKTNDGGESWIVFTTPSPNATNEIINVNTISNENIFVYPNPCSDNLIVVKNSDEIANISISNISGQIILKKTTKQIQTVVNLNNFAGGIYFLKITEKENIHIKKIILK